MNSNQKRPKFLNLFAIHLPVTGVTSFAHRASGVLLFLSIPVTVYLFGLSLRDAQGYTLALTVLSAIPIKIILTLMAWSAAHHVLAGIRFLLLDINVGEPLPVAKASAWTVNIASLFITFVVASLIWL